MTTVIHMRDRKFTDDEEYIGRGSIWGNPYKIGQDGTREEVIDKYREYIGDKVIGGPRHDKLLALDGKTLVCYCKPKACHGDVLVELIKEYKGK